MLCHASYDLGFLRWRVVWHMCHATCVVLKHKHVKSVELEKLDY